MVQNDRLDRIGEGIFWGMSVLCRKFDHMNGVGFPRLSLDLALSHTSKYMKKVVRLLVDCNLGISIVSLQAGPPPRSAVDVHWHLHSWTIF